MAQPPVVSAGEAQVRLVRRKTASTKISEYEDTLVTLIANRCGETKSSVISNAIKLLIVSVLKEGGAWKLKEESNLAKVLEIIEKDVNSFLEKCGKAF